MYCAKNARARLEAPREVLKILVDYSWPGNVRELENVIERAVVLCRGEKLSEGDLPEYVHQAEGAEPSTLTFSVGTPLDEVERRLIRETLRHARGDKSVAAQLLGISTRTIYRKLGSWNEPAYDPVDTLSRAPGRAPLRPVTLARGPGFAADFSGRFRALTRGTALA